MSYGMVHGFMDKTRKQPKRVLRRPLSRCANLTLWANFSELETFKWYVPGSGVVSTKDLVEISYDTLHWGAATLKPSEATD